MAKVLILGANSAIAREVANILASKGHTLYLASRNVERLRRFAQHLETKYGAEVFTGEFDATAYASHPLFFKKVLEEMGEVDWVLLAFGYLGDHERAVSDFSEARKILEINLMGAVSVLSVIAPYMEGRGRGVIAGISSIAGDRGRADNYVYGSAKGGLTVYLSGLRQRLFRKGVKVLTVKPGFVDTPMTSGLDLPKRLVSKPEKVAQDIVKAMERGKDVLHTPLYWWFIATAIRCIPEFVFKRMKFKR